MQILNWIAKLKPQYLGTIRIDRDSVIPECMHTA